MPPPLASKSRARPPRGAPFQLGCGPTAILSRPRRGPGSHVQGWSSPPSSRGGPTTVGSDEHLEQRVPASSPRAAHPPGARRAPGTGQRGRDHSSLRSGAARRIPRCGSQPRKPSGESRAPGGSHPHRARRQLTRPRPPRRVRRAAGPHARRDPCAGAGGRCLHAPERGRLPCTGGRPGRTGPPGPAGTGAPRGRTAAQRDGVVLDVSGSVSRARMERARLAVHRSLRTPEAANRFRTLVADAPAPACRLRWTAGAAGAEPKPPAPSPCRAGRSGNPDGRRCTERPSRALPGRVRPPRARPRRHPSTRSGALHAIGTPMHASRAKDPGAGPARKTPAAASRRRPPGDRGARRAANGRPARSAARPATPGSPRRPRAPTGGHTPNRDGWRAPCGGAGEMRARGRRLG
jgi:hypothetical protein